jgi:DNA end-binding protein Ku
MRAIWNGHIRFSLVTIPVRVYGAIETKNAISFNQLHKEDNGRVGYDKKCKKCGKSLSQNEITKGFEYETDKYVIIEQEDIDKVKIKSTKIIEIEGFVDYKEVHPTLFDTPYYIGPDGEVAAQAYSLLLQTLGETGKMAVGRVVIRDREDIVMLSPKENGMVMYKLRYPDEVRSIKEVPLLNGLKSNKEQLKLAKTLVDSMTTKLSEINMEDHYQSALKELIQAKIEGKEIISTVEEVKPVVDMMQALKESLEQAKKQKLPMEKAKGKKKKAKPAQKQAKQRKQRKQA